MSKEYTCVDKKGAVNAMLMLFASCAQAILSDEDWIRCHFSFHEWDEQTFGVNVIDFVQNRTAKIFFMYDFDALNRDDHNYCKVFADMNERANYMRGFSRVTRSIVHEAGHLATIKDILDTIGEGSLWLQRSKAHSVYDYIHLPDEWAATEWAIKWLSDPENRKMAKEFEKKFFSCFVAE